MGPGMHEAEGRIKRQRMQIVEVKGQAFGGIG